MVIAQMVMFIAKGLEEKEGMRRSPTEPHRIAGQERAHDRCDRNGSSAQKQMHALCEVPNYV